MTSNDLPVADDDFPEFSEPPRFKPAAASSPRAVEATAAIADADRPAGSEQSTVDDVIARIKRERAQGKR